MARRAAGQHRRERNVSTPTQRSGAPPQRPAPEMISHRQATDRDESTAADRTVPLPYGRNFLDTDLWLDRNGQVHSGAGPYLNRPLRRLRRAVGRWLR